MMEVVIDGKETLPFYAMQYLGQIGEVWFYQKEMSRETTRIYNLNTDPHHLVITMDVKHHLGDLHYMGGEVKENLRIKTVSITSGDFCAIDRFGIQYIRGNRKIAYFCLYANPSPAPIKEEYPNQYRRNSENY